MRRISHISDLQFVRTNPAVVEALVEELNRDAPDLIVISGDFTMATRPSEFAEARAFLDRLRENEPNAYNRIAVEDGCAAVAVQIWEGGAWIDAAPA